ncbi:MAG: hypothetical protein U1E83_08225 [Methylotetracoccus sp.]
MKRFRSIWVGGTLILVMSSMLPLAAEAASTADPATTNLKPGSSTDGRPTDPDGGVPVPPPQREEGLRPAEPTGTEPAKARPALVNPCRANPQPKWCDE